MDLNLSFGKPSQIKPASKLEEYKELLERLQGQQKSFKPNQYKEPYVEKLYFEVLSHVNLDRQPFVNKYSDQAYPSQNGPVYYLVHGHTPSVGCARPHFCHVLGYKPTGEENPAFIRAFYQKWPNLK